MTIGYPGSTSRYLSSGIREMRDAENAPCPSGGGSRDIMTWHMRYDEAAHQIRLSSPKVPTIGRIPSNEQMYRSHRHHQPEEGIRKPASAYGRTVPGYLERKTRFRYAPRLMQSVSAVCVRTCIVGETFRRTSEFSTCHETEHEHGGEGTEEEIEEAGTCSLMITMEWDASLGQKVMAALMKNL